MLKQQNGTEKVLDTADYPYGLVLNQETLDHLSLCKEQQISLVRCIENKANFVAEPYEEGKLVVFTHGYLTPGERVLLCKLRDILEGKQSAAGASRCDEAGNGKSAELSWRECAGEKSGISPVRYEHSGDLDYGGIHIYRNIREKVFPALQPYQMDLATYTSCLQNGLTEEINEAMAEKIGKLSEDPQLGQLAARLAADRRVVEQEAYL